MTKDKNTPTIIKRKKKSDRWRRSPWWRLESRNDCWSFKRRFAPGWFINLRICRLPRHSDVDLGTVMPVILPFGQCSDLSAGS